MFDNSRGENFGTQLEAYRPYLNPAMADFIDVADTVAYIGGLLNTLERTSTHRADIQRDLLESVVEARKLSRPRSIVQAFFEDTDIFGDVPDADLTQDVGSLPRALNSDTDFDGYDSDVQTEAGRWLVQLFTDKDNRKIYAELYNQRTSRSLSNASRPQAKRDAVAITPVYKEKTSPDRTGYRLSFMPEDERQAMLAGDNTDPLPLGSSRGNLTSVFREKREVDQARPFARMLSRWIFDTVKDEPERITVLARRMGPLLYPNLEDDEREDMLPELLTALKNCMATSKLLSTENIRGSRYVGAYTEENTSSDMKETQARELVTDAAHEGCAKAEAVFELEDGDFIDAIIKFVAQQSDGSLGFTRRAIAEHIRKDWPHLASDSGELNKKLRAISANSDGGLRFEKVSDKWPLPRLFATDKYVRLTIISDREQAIAYRILANSLGV